MSSRLPTQELDVKIVRLQQEMSPLAEGIWNRIADERYRPGRQ